MCLAGRTESDERRKIVKRIIWAHDGTLRADRALPTVTDLANSTGATLVLACVHRDWHIGSHEILPEDHEPLDAVLRRRVEALVAEGFPAELTISSSRQGHPADLIADLAAEEKADLIVTSSHGYGPVAGMLMGSFTSHLLKVAHCPVLVVPPGVLAPSAN